MSFKRNKYMVFVMDFCENKFVLPVSHVSVMCLCDDGTAILSLQA